MTQTEARHYRWERLRSPSGSSHGHRKRRKQVINDAVELWPRSLAIALVAHDNRIAGVELLIQHVAAGKFGADQVPHQLVELVA